MNKIKINNEQGIAIDNCHTISCSGRDQAVVLFSNYVIKVVNHGKIPNTKLIEQKLANMKVFFGDLCAETLLVETDSYDALTRYMLFQEKCAVRLCDLPEAKLDKKLLEQLAIYYVCALKAIRAGHHIDTTGFQGDTNALFDRLTDLEKKEYGLIYLIKKITKSFINLTKRHDFRCSKNLMLDLAGNLKIVDLYDGDVKENPLHNLCFEKGVVSLKSKSKFKTSDMIKKNAALVGDLFSLTTNFMKIKIILWSKSYKISASAISSLGKIACLKKNWFS